MAYISVGKCVYKENKSGGRGAEVGCSKNEIKQFFRGLNLSNPKDAKKEIAEVKSALVKAAKYAELEENYMGVVENIKSSYEKMAEMKHKDFLKQLKEVMKMNKNLQKLHKEYTKDLK